MKCTRCGKEMVNTIGGNYTCPSCNFAVNDLIYRPSNCDMPLPQGFGKQEGWICPVCGRGVAPWTSFCPCQSDWKITYGTSTGGGEVPSVDEELNRLFELGDLREKELIEFYEKYGD